MVERGNTTADFFPLGIDCFGISETFGSPVEEWNECQVLHWMAVSGFTRFIELFRKQQIKGRTLVQMANPSKITDSIKDITHRDMLAHAVKVLLNMVKSPSALLYQTSWRVYRY